uniref:U27-Deinotoxin-Dsu1a_1 n=1 Tax=Deinopis subrufa TaxID=1905329 RepID=A0A4V2H9I9_DEISU
MKLYIQILFLLIALFVFVNAESSELDEFDDFEYGKVEQESVRNCNKARGRCGGGARCCHGLRCQCKGPRCQCVFAG